MLRQINHQHVLICWFVCLVELFELYTKRGFWKLCTPEDWQTNWKFQIKSVVLFKNHVQHEIARTFITSNSRYYLSCSNKVIWISVVAVAIVSLWTCFIRSFKAPIKCSVLVNNSVIILISLLYISRAIRKSGFGITF